MVKTGRILRKSTQGGRKKADGRCGNRTPKARLASVKRRGTKNK